ncbi:MAG: DUF2726 domain-containing protein [Lachnospiraceae bacterium]|nr:DUF2726 domain-containing protein [Lachnospiraceae bacterium]
MDSVSREIFRAIHEGKWLKIEYLNKKGETTKYWGGITGLDPEREILNVDGLHLSKLTIAEKMSLTISSIKSAEVVEGTYCEINQKLVDDIAEFPEKYDHLFGNAANLKILTYLEECHRMDKTPFYNDHTLVSYLDDSRLENGYYQLSDDQFRQIVNYFQKRSENQKQKSQQFFQQLAMNMLSIYTDKGLYVLAYRVLNLDVKLKSLRPAKEITVCTEFQIDGNNTESARRFLDADDYELLNDFEKNAEMIKDRIMRGGRDVKVDDIPHIISVARNTIIDLHKEYKSIIAQYESGQATFPIRAFFGSLTERPRRTKAYPLALVGKVNLDQLLAINNAMKYPLTYVQGPPGTGKTNTIINTIVTAFFNDRTVLFASNNNHPLDTVFEKMAAMTYRNYTIPFPILRLGNQDKILEAVDYIQNLRRRVSMLNVQEAVLDKRKADRIERAQKLANILRQYEILLDYKDREETLERMIDFQNKHPGDISMMPFNADLSGRQLSQIRTVIHDRDNITEESALELLDKNEHELFTYLNFTSAKYIKRLDLPAYKEFCDILKIEDKADLIKAFNDYTQEPENLKKLLRVFPVIVTTCVSASRLGDPKPSFDMVIMDEASQCNTALSLVPIIRGENLMLVGDPQQLKPVIVLDPVTNTALKKKYQVSDEYDYRENSIYKTFLACDSVSDEILLRKHYRCSKKIIEFNNKKYYNSQLDIRTQNTEARPLVFADVKTGKNNAKNSSQEEADQIISYALANKDKSIGVITPFVNQKALIETELQREQVSNVVCGTVHSFQGDEKDVILFSTAVGDGTSEGTYRWLCNNRELINVATSRARKQLIVLGDKDNISRLHSDSQPDDLYELVQYVRQNGDSVVTSKQTNSRALGVKPFSTETEEAFLTSLTHALGNIWLTQSRFSVKKEVAIAQVFSEDLNYSNLFYTGRFDFVVYEKRGNGEIPLLAIELDGKEHYNNEIVKRRDQKKQEICDSHHLKLIRVENSYARRYNYIKDILENYFKAQRR